MQPKPYTGVQAAPRASSRSENPDVRNPLLKLPASLALYCLADGERIVLRQLLDEIRRSARAQADNLWARRKTRRAAFWRACSVYAGHAARLAHPRTSASPKAITEAAHACVGINPLLALPAVQAMQTLPPTTREAMRALLAQLRADAMQSSDNAWAKSKSPMAAYWADVATFAGLAERHLRDRPTLAAPHAVSCRPDVSCHPKPRELEIAYG